jgi:hypothetical protein
MTLSSLILAIDCGIPDELATTVQGGVPGPGTSQFEFAWIQPLIPSSPWRVSKSKPPAPHQSHKSHKSFFLPFFKSCGCLWKRKLHGEQLPNAPLPPPPGAAPPSAGQHQRQDQRQQVRAVYPHSNSPDPQTKSKRRPYSTLPLRRARQWLRRRDDRGSRRGQESDRRGDEHASRAGIESI